MFAGCRTACSEDERALFSEDDMMSDSGGSSLTSRKNSLEQVNNEIIMCARYFISYSVILINVACRVLTRTWSYLLKLCGITLLSNLKNYRSTPETLLKFITCWTASGGGACAMENRDGFLQISYA